MHLLNVNGFLTTSFDYFLLERVKNECDRRLQFSVKFSWSGKCFFREQIGLAAFFKIKNISKKCQQKPKLIIYYVYVLAIITYCFQAWFTRKEANEKN